MEYMSIGHKVMVVIPAEDRKSFAPQAQYHGQEMKIANRVKVKHSENVYYELVGAESKYGIPYAFLREWLIQL